MRDARQSWHEEHLEIVEELREIRRHQHAILHKLEQIEMAIPQAVTDILAALDKATNDVAAKLDALAAQIKTGMTQADVDSVVASIKGESDKLEGLAADPANPVPPTV